MDIFILYLNAWPCPLPAPRLRSHAADSAPRDRARCGRTATRRRTRSTCSPASRSTRRPRRSRRTRGSGSRSTRSRPTGWPSTFRRGALWRGQWRREFCARMCGADAAHQRGSAAVDGKSFFPGMQSFFPKSAFCCILLHLTSLYLHCAAFAFCITSHSITSGNIFQAHMRQNADPTSCHINTTFDMSHWFAFTRIILHVSRKHSITLLDVNIHLDLYCIQQHFVRVHPI